ncbi:putative ABC transporter domain-containing protein [Seiridium cardinale]|uniref:ABC transporter domain-containing protein n=1 Tax=Seiridium cardinale TaxID=138064 RepID=A0ABR2XU31_9PEZI
MQLYSQRLIKEKWAKFAFVHPFAEAIASVVVDFSMKLFRRSMLIIVLYFMADIRQEQAQFFVFYLFLVTAIPPMPGISRIVGAATKSVSQAMSIAGILVLCIVVHTGFPLPQPYMHPWFSWIDGLIPSTTY